MRISASSFVAFRQCPELANARLHGEYGPDTVGAFRGGLAHRLFARHLESGAIPSEDFEQACKEEIGRSSLNHKMASLGLKGAELDRVFEVVRSLYDRFASLSTEGFSRAEVELEAEPAPGVQLSGSVDAVFERSDGEHLVDWKTGGLGEVVAQLSFYSLLWWYVYGQLPASAEAVSIGTGERTSERPTHEKASETIREVADMVMMLRTAWASGDALPRHGGPWCVGCARLPGCVEGQAAMRIAAPRAGD